jgi:hypothetical protein
MRLAAAAGLQQRVSQGADTGPHFLIERIDQTPATSMS